MILVVVYVGAVAVLFMFVVMMLDINFLRMREGFMQLPAGRARWSASSCWPSSCWSAAPGRRADTDGGAGAAGGRAGGVATPRRSATCSTPQYFYLFQTAGMILLVAIIGAITLTLRQRRRCGGRTSAGRSTGCARETVELRKVRSGSGI